MSEENVEIVRRGIAAWNAGDLEGMLMVYHPELELRVETDEHGQPIFPGLEPFYFGHDGFRRLWGDWVGVFEQISIDVEKLVSDEDHVVLLSRFHGVAHGGVYADREIATALTIRDGLIWRQLNFPRWEEALEAAGLSE